MSEGAARLYAVVWFEIYQGVRGMWEERIAEELVELCPLLPIDVVCWSEAASLDRAGKLGGLNCPLAGCLDRRVRTSSGILSQKDRPITKTTVCNFRSENTYPVWVVYAQNRFRRDGFR